MKTEYARLISSSALIALTGFLLSGPVGLLLVKMIAPQPQWESPAVFANHYHIVQDVPFYFGFLLIGGMVMLMVGHYLTAENEPGLSRFYTLLALSATAVFAALIFFNYVCQTTFVRHLALHYQPAYDAMIATFSMANPMSLCWGIEMWGYGILGVATWLLAVFYKEKNRLIYWLLIGNGLLSVAGVVGTVVDVGWLLMAGGLAAYFLWNVLMVVLVVVMYRFWKAQQVS